MSYVKTLYKYNFDFTKLPPDLIEASSIVLKNVVFNAKINLLDAVVFNSIRNTQPTNSIIEVLYDIYKNENTLRNNNGFNSLREIDQAADLFSDKSIQTKLKQHYQSSIPKDHDLVEIEFDRDKYDYISAKEWLMRNEFDLSFPTFTEKTITFRMDGGPFNDVINFGSIKAKIYRK